VGKFSWLGKYKAYPLKGTNLTGVAICTSERTKGGKEKVIKPIGSRRKQIFYSGRASEGRGGRGRRIARRMASKKLKTKKKKRWGIVTTNNLSPLSNKPETVKEKRR